MQFVFKLFTLKLGNCFIMLLFYLKLPFVFLKFWFIEAPRGMVLFFSSLNNKFLKLTSLPLFVKTYFDPLEESHRKVLVSLSIGIGMFMKTFVIIADFFLFVALLAIELLILTGFIIWPALTIWVLFI